MTSDTFKNYLAGFRQAKALFDTNVFGIVRATKAVLPTKRAQRSGRIVNTTSVVGFMPAPFMGLCAATEHALSPA